MKYFLNGKIDNVYCSRALELEYKEKAMHDDNALFPFWCRVLPDKTVMILQDMEWVPLSDTRVYYNQNDRAFYKELPISVQEHLKIALKKYKFKELMINFFVDVCFLMIVCLTFLYTEVSVPALYMGCVIAGGFCFVFYTILMWQT